jgi:anti-sigma B factor antagonist
MDGRLTGADALPCYAGFHTAVPDARAYDLIDVVVHYVAPGITLVRVCGEVDLLTALVLRTELQYQLGLLPSVLVVDLTHVTFFGAAGIEVLIDSHRRACRTAIPLRLVHNTGVVARVLKLVQVDRLFPTYLKLTDALTG